MQAQTTAAQLHEDQLLNFIVNLLTSAYTLDLDDNARLTAAEFWDVLVGCTASGTSITDLCRRSDNAPSANDVLYHLRTKFDLDDVRQLGSVLLQTEVIDRLPEAVEIVVDLHLRPYYGDQHDTTGLYHSEARAGTTAFHAYATLYARVRHKRYTLAVRRVTDGDTVSEVLAAFLGLAGRLPFDVKAVYLDRGFYDGKCLTLLQAHNYAYVMPVVKWGPSIKGELSEGWSRQIEHELTTGVDEADWTVDFPVYVDCTYQQGRAGEHGVARHGYAADAPFIEDARDARHHYGKRFGIEASYRLAEQSVISTTSRDPVRRLLFVVLSLLLQNVWRLLHWEFVSTPRRGCRELREWPFTEFIDMVTHAAWRGLSVRQSVPANKPPDDRFRR